MAESSAKLKKKQVDPLKRTVFSLALPIFFQSLLGLSLGYIDCKVDGNTYNGQTKDVNTVGVKSVLIVSDRLSNDKVKTLTKLVFDNANELQLTVSADLDIIEKDAVTGVNIPFHSGAAEYYSEKGIEVKTAE